MRLIGGLGVVVAVLVGVTGLSGQGRSPREWRDYAGGPDSSRFVAATADQQVQREPAAGRVDLSRRARPTSIRSSCAASSTAVRADNTFVALDAATGKELWIHDGDQGFNSPRRELLGEHGRHGPPPDLQHEQHPAGDRRADRPAHSVVRHGRRRRPARGPRPRSRDDQPAEPHCRDASSRTSSSSARRPIRSTRRRLATSARSTCAPARSSGRFTPCRGRASSATTRGRRTRGRRSAAPTTGASSRSTTKRGIVYVPTGSAEVQLLRRQPARRQPLRRLPHRARRADRQAPLALPDGPPRHLGPRQQLGAAADDHPPQRPERSTSSRMASKTGYLYVFDRVTGKPIWPIEERPVPQKHDGARRGAVADAAVSDQPAAVLAPEVHGGRSESAHPHARGTRAVQAAHPEGEKRRSVHADRLRRRRSTCRATRADRTGAARRRTRPTAAST